MSDEKERKPIVGQQDARGRFIKGNTIQPGRPKSSRQKLSDKFIHTLHADFKEHGAAAVIACRETDPSTYVRVVASLLPKQVDVTVNPLETMNDDELASAIRQLEQTIAGYIAPVIDGTCEAQDGTETAIGDDAAQALPAICETVGVPRGKPH